MLSNLLAWMDIAGTFAFGLSGGTLAVRKQFDLFGVIVLAAAAATAGGAVRDMAMGDLPIAVLRDGRYLLAALAAGLVAFFANQLVEGLRRPVMLLDALGLGIFAVSGSQKALLLGLHPAAACLIGALTAVGGGVARDVLAGEVPKVLKEEIYAGAALVGAGIAVVGHLAGWPMAVTAIAGISLTFTVRVASVWLGLSLPRARR